MVVTLAACAQSYFAHDPRAPATDHVRFVDAMRGRGLMVDPVAQVRQPFLTPSGTLLRISGAPVSGTAELESYNYDERDLGWDGHAVAAADASRVARDGQPRDASLRVYYPGPPHFFRRERVIVLYVGSDTALLGLLRELLGPPFAGVQVGQ